MPLSKITNPFLDPAGSARSNVYSPSANTIGIVTAGTERVRVDSSGNMGIGTNSPSARLDVRTTSSTQATFTRTGQTAVCSLFQSSADTYLSATNSGANLILATQDTERVRIDSAGRLTNAYTPFFYAERSGSNQTGYDASSQGDVVVIYNSAITNTGSHYSTSTGKFTAPVAGVYAFFASAYSSVNNFNQMWLVLNGSRATGTDWNYGSGAVNFQVGHWIIKLSANDTVGFHPYNGSVSSGQIDVNSAHVYFRGVLLS
jgi:hypothetical protein